MPKQVEGRLVKTAATYVNGGADPVVVVEAAGGLVLMGLAFARAYEQAHRERALPSEVQRATWAAFEMMAHGRRWKVVRRTLERAAERRISLTYAYGDVEKEGSYERLFEWAHQMDEAKAAGNDIGFAELIERTMSPSLREALELAQEMEDRRGR